MHTTSKGKQARGLRLAQPHTLSFASRPQALCPHISPKYSSHLWGADPACQVELLIGRWQILLQESKYMRMCSAKSAVLSSPCSLRSVTAQSLNIFLARGTLISSAPSISALVRYEPFVTSTIFRRVAWSFEADLGEVALLHQMNFARARRG
jgi:hypothetical protein